MLKKTRGSFSTTNLFFANGLFLHLLKTSSNQRFSDVSRGYRKTNVKQVNPFQPSAAFHIKTSHLTCNPNQMTDFYMESSTGMKWVNPFQNNVSVYFI